MVLFEVTLDEFEERGPSEQGHKGKTAQCMAETFA